MASTRKRPKATMKRLEAGARKRSRHSPELIVAAVERLEAGEGLLHVASHLGLTTDELRAYVEIVVGMRPERFPVLSSMQLPPDGAPFGGGE
jgi:hypothetical protein